MNIFALLSLTLPLIAAALEIRQEGKTITEVGCADLCLVSALADSVKSPRCGLAPQDLRCLCGDSGWASSYDKCIRSICPQEDVISIYRTLGQHCKGIDSPFTAEPTFASSTEASISATSVVGSTDGSPSSTATATASSGPPSAGANATEIARASAISVASSVLAGTTLPVYTGIPSAAPTSAAAKFHPPTGLVAGLSTFLALGYFMA